jgi:GNAT superfamily N-acetyltransferase
MDIRLIEIDRESAQDCDAFVSFVNLHYPSKIPANAAPLRAGSMIGFWAKRGQEVLGTCAYIAKTPFLAETVKTVVHPLHRGKGMGPLLSQAIEDEVRRRGFTKVMTTIYIDNLPMIFIKLRQGYRFEGFHPDHEKPGLHEYSLGKVLS